MRRQIAVVYQYVEDFGNPRGSIVRDTGVELAEADARAGRERPLRGGLRQDLHRDRKPNSCQQYSGLLFG